MIDQVPGALEAAMAEREWLYGVLENQTCSDLCDKTHEFQGCPSGTCARESGLRSFRETTEKIAAALDGSQGEGKVVFEDETHWGATVRIIQPVQGKEEQ